MIPENIMVHERSQSQNPYIAWLCLYTMFRIGTVKRQWLSSYLGLRALGMWNGS